MGLHNTRQNIAAGIRYYEEIKSKVDEARASLNQIDASVFIVAGHHTLNLGIAASRVNLATMSDLLDEWITMLAEQLDEVEVDW